MFLEAHILPGPFRFSPRCLFYFILFPPTFFACREEQLNSCIAAAAKLHSQWAGNYATHSQGHKLRPWTFGRSFVA